MQSSTSGWNDSVSYRTHRRLWVASFAWETDGEVTAINVWDSPDAIADFFVERVHAVVEQHGPPANKPERLGPALHGYVRPTS